MTEHYDIIILGGGNAGFGVSSVAHAAGKRIAFVEGRDFGGTCPNRGCTPKKIMVAAGHSLEEISRAKAHGIEIGEPVLDWTTLVDRTQEMVGFIPGAMHDLAAKRGDVYTGTARFVGRNTIEVNGTRLEGDHIVVATGSTPRPLPIPGAEHLITSDEVLSEREQPTDVVFIGGGVIAMEFGHLYARAGTQVTVLEALPQLLPRLDQDAVAVLQAESERLGMTIETKVNVLGIEPRDGRFDVRYEVEGQEQIVSATRVVNGAGRVANVSALDLDAAGVEVENGRIAVDEYLRSVSNPNVWVAGDALAISPQLSPLATEEGQLVGRNIVAAPSETIDYGVIPSAVYTVPALATVGMTEAEAERDGREIEVKVNDMSGWFSSKAYAEPVAWAKVIVDTNTDAILGAHLVGHHAEDLVHTFALAMQHGISASALRSSRFAYPSFSSDIRNLL